jgi:hypothetical protein
LRTDSYGFKIRKLEKLEAKLPSLLFSRAFSVHNYPRCKERYKFLP